MTRAKKDKRLHGKLNSRQNKEKVWALRSLLAAAAQKPIQGPRKPTWEEVFAEEQRVRAEEWAFQEATRKARRAKELRENPIYPAPLGPYPEYVPPEQVDQGLHRRQPARLWAILAASLAAFTLSGDPVRNE